MFGQPSNNSPFSTSNNTPFGGGASPAPFGSPAPAPFGGGNGFGGGGGFGAPAPAPTAFGGGGAFGAPSPSPGPFGGGGFGSSAPAPVGFGTTPTNNSSPFGAPAAAPTGGIFGAPAPATGGLFGAASPAPSGFGSTTNTSFGGGGFGAPAPAPTAFGGGGFGSPAPAPTGSIFGAPAPTSTFGGFGAQTPAPAPMGGGMFGAPAPAMGGGLFGSTPAGGSGSKVAPFSVTSRTDGNSTTSISFQSITAMQQYEGKSFEEIRFEDYAMGNKGDGSGNNTASTGFGGGTFGTPAAAPAFGGGGFGSPAPAPAFGSTAPAPFGAAPATGGFGSPAPAPFGAAPATGGFGSPAPAPAFGGFGAKPATGGGLFGAPAPAPAGGGLFGAPAPAAGGGLFGAPAPAPAGGGLFGAPTPAPAFGSPAAAPGGFGATKPGGLFGAPAPATGGIFGATPAPAAGGLFGATPAPAAGGGLFGAPSPAAPAFGAPASTPLFGSPAAAPSTGGLFGAPTTTPGTPAAPAFASPLGTPASIIPPAADAALQQQLAAIENQKKELEKLEVWRGKSPSGSSIIPASLSEPGSAIKLSPYRGSNIPTYRASPMSTTKIRPRGFGSTPSKTPVKISESFGRGNNLQSPAVLAASSAKRLVINAEAHTPKTPKPSLLLRLTNNENESSSKNGNGSTPLRLNGDTKSNTNDRMSSLQTPESIKTPSSFKTGAPTGSGRKATPDTAHEFYNKLVSSPKLTKPNNKSTPTPAPTPTAAVASESWRPRLTMGGYRTIPSITEMNRMSEADLAALSGLIITKDGVGSVSWEGTVDVRGADFDSIVSIEHQVVAVYEEYEAIGKKPQNGEKLNRPAIITLHNTFPRKGGKSAAEEVKDKFARKLQKNTIDMGADFISYDKDEGTWVFKVAHFSRYGYIEEESDSEDEINSEDEIEDVTPRKVTPGNDSPRSLVLKTISPTRFTVPVDEDDDDDDGDVQMMSRDLPSNELVVMNATETNEMDSEPLYSAAKESYKAMFLSPRVEVPQPVFVEEEKDDDSVFFEETWEDDGPSSLPVVPQPTLEQMRLGNAFSICSKIKEQSGISKSSHDIGLRMGRSFRVGWRPDGSFIHLSSGTTLQLSRPQFSKRSVKKTVQLLDVHLENAEKNKEKEFSFSEPNSIGKTLQKMSDVTKSKDGVSESDSTLNQAFSLVGRLINIRKEENDNASLIVREKQSLETESLRALDNICVTETFKRWLKKACISTSSESIKSLQQQGKIYDAIFFSLAAGDIMQASSIASDARHLQLAALIASGPCAGEFIREQVRQWRETGAAMCMPQELLRIYSVLGGDFGIEEQRFKDGDESCDWLKRLSLLLSYGKNDNGGNYDFSSLIKKYEDDVSSGKAPKPEPFHCKKESASSRSKSLIYYLIQLCPAIAQGKEEKLRLSDVIQPIGHTSSRHDFSGAFQLATFLSGLKCCIPLTEIEQAQLLSSYAAQLIISGKWVYAVYVLLCSVGKSSLKSWRQNQAKRIVLQHLRPEDKNLVTTLVGKIGVPITWIQEGLAERFAYSGNVFAFVEQARHFSMDRAREALEETIVPTSFFKNPAEAKKCLEFLRPFSGNPDTLAGTIYQLYELSQEIEELSDETTAESASLPGDLYSKANLIERNLLVKKSSLENLSYPKLNRTGETVVPMSSFLSESLSGISYLKLQIQALESGGSIWDNSRKGELKHSMQLVSDTRMGSESVLKATSLKGFF